MEAGTAIDSRFHTAMIRTPRFGLRPLLQSNDPTSTGGQEFPAASGKAAAHPLDAVTGGVFSAATSGERAARLRAWLATEPEVAVMQEVFRDLSTRDKGAAKPLLTLLVGALFVVGPDTLLDREVEERRFQIRRKLPDVMDLLVISVEAGLGFERDHCGREAPDVHLFVGERRVCSGSERRVCARRRTARSYVRRTPRALSGPVAFAQSVRSLTFAEGQRQALGRPAPRSAACSAVAAPAVWPAATMPSHIDAAVFR